MMEWGEEHDAKFEHYFLYVSLNRAVHDFKNGKTSAWVILNSFQAKEMLSKMSDEQLDIIGPMLDIKYWKRKFSDHPADVVLVKEILEEVNIR